MPKLIRFRPFSTEVKTLEYKESLSDNINTESKICAKKIAIQASSSSSVEGSKKIYMAIDLEAILYATDIVNEKFSIWDIPNNVDVEFKKAIKRLKGTYYWLPVDRMLQKAELLEVNGDPGPLLFYGEYVTIINENKAFNIESAEAATMYHITSKGVAFFNFLLCESVINRMFYHPTKFTFK